MNENMISGKDFINLLKSKKELLDKEMKQYSDQNLIKDETVYIFFVFLMILCVILGGGILLIFNSLLSFPLCCLCSLCFFKISKIIKSKYKNSPLLIYGASKVILRKKYEYLNHILDLLNEDKLYNMNDLEKEVDDYLFAYSIICENYYDVGTAQHHNKLDKYLSDFSFGPGIKDIIIGILNGKVTDDISRYEIKTNVINTNNGISPVNHEYDSVLKKGFSKIKKITHQF